MAESVTTEIVPVEAIRALAEPWVEIFLASVRGDLDLSAACKKAGIKRSELDHRVQTDPEFAARVQGAIDECLDNLEGVAVERAKKYSDTLLIFLLKSRRREVYGDRVLVGAQVRLTWDLAVRPPAGT